MNYRYWITSFISFILLNSCSMHPSKEQQAQKLLGKWQLTETLADIGDGNATWHAASQPVFVEFTADGRHIMQTGNDTRNGTFEIENDSTLVIRRDAVAFKTAYVFNGELLQLTPPCIEACGERYKRVQ